MHPRAIDVGPDDPAAPVDSVGEGVKGTGDIEGREHRRLIEKAMLLHILVAPDDLAADLDETVTTQVAEDSSDVRWQVEELHRAAGRIVPASDRGLLTILSVSPGEVSSLPLTEERWKSTLRRLSWLS